MINVLMVIPNRGDATSFYRGMGPWTEMRRRSEFNMIYTDAVDWSILRLADFVFMQRPFTKEHKALAIMAKQWDIPLWVDYDDNLFAVPTDNPAHGLYSSDETQKAVAEITSLATVVTVSTEQLKRCLQIKEQPLNNRVYVVPNALPDFLVKRKAPFNFKKQINWRGSNTHMRDVFQFAPEISQVAQENPDTTFTFIGSNPWALTDHMRPNQAIVVPPMGIGDYIEFMRVTNPSIQIVPLDDSIFNRCKSNIAWIEATLAGGVCIAPEWEEWVRPGVLTYRTTEDFKACMEFALTNPEKLAEQHEISWEYVQEHLVLSKVNEIRFQIMDTLAEAATQYYSRPARHVPIGWPIDGEPKAAPDNVMVLE